MAAFLQAVTQHGPRLMRLSGVRLGEMAIRTADIAGMRLDEMAIRLTDIAGLRKGEPTQERCKLTAAMRHDHSREAAVARMGIGPYMPAMRPAFAPSVGRPAAGAP